jgi:hypothetical protein
MNATSAHMNANNTFGVIAVSSTQSESSIQRADREQAEQAGQSTRSRPLAVLAASVLTTASYTV